MLTLTLAVFPLASPDQFSKRYSPAGVAVKETEVPCLCSPELGDTDPPSDGLTFTVSV